MRTGDMVSEVTATSHPAVPLAYATGGVAERGQFWAWAFLLSGGYALACIPAVFVFEHFDWFEAPLHLSSFAAWVICPISAIFYLWRNRGGGERRTLAARRTRTLAYLAIGVSSAALLFVIGLVILIMMSPGLDD